MRADKTSGSVPVGSSDRAIWLRSQAIELADDEPERFLDLAGFADGRLDEDECDRVAAWLASEPALAADVEAARAAAGVAFGEAPGSVIARADGLVAGTASGGNVIPFPFWRRRAGLRGVAGWTSLAAATLVASWLGFVMGSEVSLAVHQAIQVSDEGSLGDMLDPSLGFMRDLTEGTQT